MRLTLGGLAKDVAPGLPMMEAIPAELVSRADLIGEAKRVDPAFLLGAPSAVPRKFDGAGLATALNRDRSDEIRTARPRIDLESVYGPLRMRVQQLIDEPDDLDPRDVPDQRDRGRVVTRPERYDVSLEAFRSARARKDLGVYRHGRNISRVTSVLFCRAALIQTNLTGGSTLNAQRENRPW